MRRLLAGFLVWVASATPGSAQEIDPERARALVDGLQSDLQEVIAKVAPAVGAVTNYAGTFDEKTGKVDLRPRGQGSGLIVTRDGFLLTNKHVIKGASRITVAIEEGIFEADLYADNGEGPVKGDIALLKLRGKKQFPFVDWHKGDSDRLEPGAFVFAMGNPYGHAMDGKPVATVGIVSGKGRAASERGYFYVDALQTDAEINPGNSGGPLFDSRGRFIGINGLMASRQGRSNSGVGFAIPINQVKLFVRRLLKEEGGSVQYGYHGLALRTTPKEDGALVWDIRPGSPAMEKGMRRRDVIFKAKGKRINNRSDFVNVVGRLPAGSLVTLSVRRGRNVKVFRFKLTDAPASKRSGPPLKGYPLSQRGFLGAEYAGADGGAVHLTRVLPGGPAARAGMQTGDVLRKIDGQSVTGPTLVAGLLKSFRSGDAVQVTWSREGRTQQRRLTLCSLAEAAGVER